jgi:hypothetical protein
MSIGLYEVIKGLLTETKPIILNQLPSQGVFYKSDFKIKIKKADVEDIIEYEFKFDKTNLLSSIDCIKNVIMKNAFFSKGYSYKDIKSIDIIYIFLEIVKFTLNKDINISYTNYLGEEAIVSFGNETFKYYDFGQFVDIYDTDTNEFVVNGYRFSLPSIGVEASLTQFLFYKQSDKEFEKYNDYCYNFMYFIGHKSSLTFPEIENLIQIFNFDLDETEIELTNNIVDFFSGVVSYTLKNDDGFIDIKAKLDLETIWKS